MFTSLNVSDFAFLTLGIVGLRYLLVKRGRAPHPPGPKGWPIIGNVLDMPTEKMWLVFAKWGERWGDIVYVNLLGQPMVFLNSANTAVETLDKKSSIYSDRPSFTMAGELAGWAPGLGFLHYGDRFRETRRLLHRVMGTKTNMEAFLPMVDLETRRFMKRVLNDPENVYEWIRKAAGATILNLAYGYQVKEGHDEFVDLIDRAMKQFSIMTTPNAFLVDAFPILRHVPSWFPGAGFKRIAAEYKETCTDMANLPFEYVKQQMASSAGTALPSFSSNHLESGKLTEEQDSIIKWAACSLYAGGSDTTVSAIYTFFLAMTLFPDIQKKAQDELDAVVGTDRLPVFGDREHLPYVEALVKEVFRWHPVAPLGVPHRLMEDDVHNGYLIPKGSIVIPNIWNILHNPDAYKNPMTFGPERFLPTPGNTAEPDPRTYCFGFGRRSFPEGLNLADASVFMTCAMTLSAFNITKALNADGSVITPPAEFLDGTVSHPKPFQCSIRPRSSKSVALIHSSE
ncbi:hypothetical protein JAAARDRAFT_122537 [Jaapia argillacea MUCL 33604]|uniref:Cytochrome P450 n=1 Tax=Jaapia argillacea MUCL 33604 TaxID=933084 RepID=A0A067Q4R7_9AGAM|nr:hypothetical protein JAAARDRAFT_122537 [Jaapia argillacea MUCL 33604]